MPRRRRRRGGGSPWIAIGIAGFATASALLVGGYFWLRHEASKQVALGEDLCPVDGPVSVTAVLLDTTDPITKTTHLDLRTELDGQIGRVTTGGLLAVYGLTDTPGKLDAYFLGCNPGDGSGADAMTQNPARLKERWKAAFADPLSKVLVDVNPSAASGQSPILAGIQRIKLELFQRFPGSGISKYLVVASDMIENTELYSQYRAGADFGAYERSPARDEYRTSLAGVAVTFLDFQRRQSRLDPREHAEFWKRWVDSHGGAFEKWVRLEGLN